MPPPSLYWLLTVAKTEVLRRAGVLSPHPTALFRVSTPAFPPSGQLEPSDQDRPGPQTATPAPGCAPDVTEATSRCTGRPSPPSPSVFTQVRGFGELKPIDLTAGENVRTTFPPTSPTRLPRHPTRHLPLLAITAGSNPGPATPRTRPTGPAPSPPTPSPPA